MRAAYASRYDAGLSAEIGSAYNFGAGFVGRASISRTRRVPTAEELFLFFDHSEVGYIVVGNPELQPETLNSFRLGSVFRTDDRHFGIELQGFVHLIENGIVSDSVPDEPSTFTSVNAGKLMTGGVNASLQLNRVPSWLSTRLNYAFLPIARELESGDRLPLRTAHSARFETVGSFFDRSLETRMSLGGRAALSVPEGSPAAPAYLLVGAGVAYRWHDSVRVAFDVENMLDQTNATWGPIPGFHGLLSLSLNTP